MRTLQVATLTLLLSTSTALADNAPALYLPLAVADADFRSNGDEPEAKVELGRMLFFDKILSGNRNISCATCHHPELASADAVALSFGEGPSGLGVERTPGTSEADAVHERVPRNAPALFNLGAREFTRMFHDGRVETDPEGYYEGGFITPAKWKLPTGLESVLAAQAMFPVTSSTEMAGQKGENPIADAQSLNNAAGRGGVWELLADRLREVPRYVEMFRSAFPEAVDGPGDISFVHAANAIAAFEASAFRADDSPFDRFLRGEASLDSEAAEGMRLFYGKANCSSCHSGKFQTDHEFHAIAMPQVGPGKSDGWNQDYWRVTGMRAFPEDFGRGRVTTRAEDRYRFRTPSLRNVALTGPWGHAGTHDSLESIVRHHLDPIESLESYDPSQAGLVPIPKALELTVSGSRARHSWLNDNRLAGLQQRDTWVHGHDELRRQIAAANELDPLELSNREVRSLVAFLESLTDPASTNLSHLVPLEVPSGLPVAD